MTTRFMDRVAAVVLGVLALGACNANTSVTPLPARAPLAHERDSAVAAKIKHVVIVVQENRSFNNLFYGFRGSKYSRYGYTSRGHRVALQPIPLEIAWDLEH